MRQGNRVFFAAICCAVVMGAGCAALKESARGIAGVSTKVLEDGRKDAVKRSYPVDYATCLKTVNEALDENKAYVYARAEEPKMIAFYLTEEDTTPVGVFFTAQGGSATEVAVSSPSRYAKESIADKIAAQFNKKPALPGIPAPTAAGTPAAGNIPAQEDKK
jgi:hypothetical protein